MRHFLSYEVGKICFGTSSRSIHYSTPTVASVRNLCVALLVVCSAFLSSSSFAQQPFLTSRADISRSGANTNETLLTPANVSKNSFGRLFSFPVDYVVMAQPLYMPNVNISGHGTHNVIYIVTQADSVYAIDADNGAQRRWHHCQRYISPVRHRSRLQPGRHRLNPGHRSHHQHHVSRGQDSSQHQSPPPSSRHRHHHRLRAN